jgi:hypothetical protein
MTPKTVSEASASKERAFCGMKMGFAPVVADAHTEHVAPDRTAAQICRSVVANLGKRENVCSLTKFAKGYGVRGLKLSVSKQQGVPACDRASQVQAVRR